MSRFKDAIVLTVATFLIIVAIFSTQTNNTGNDLFGFASSPIYYGYAVPINGIVVDTNLNFASPTDVVQKPIDVTDDIIYRQAYVSYDGQSWTPFNLTPTGTLSGVWIYGRGNANMNFTPAKLNLNNTRTSSNNTYIIIYTCSKNTTIHNWSCHEGWQIIPFKASLNSGSSSGPSITSISPANGLAITTSTQTISATTTDTSSTSTWIDFDRSLIGYWSMDSYVTGGINDISSYGGAAAFTSGLSSANIISTGARGKAIDLDGIDDYLTLPASASTAGRSEFSVSLWAYFTDITTQQSIYSDNIANNNLWKFAINQGVATAGRLDMELRNSYSADTGSRITITSSTNTPINQWVHIVAVYSVSNGYAKLYMNGNEVGSITSNIQPFTSTSSIAKLGNDADNADPSAFSGYMDEAMIFSRALSAAEVKSLYNSQSNALTSTFTNLFNGQHTYTIYATDAAGNTANSGQRTLNVNAAATCSNDCTSSGLKQCSVTGYQTCGNYDTDICLEWSSTTACPSGQTCSGAGICSTPTAYCGDGTCNNGETCSSCPGDCGSCSTGTCGSGYNCGTISGVNCGQCPTSLSCTNNLCTNSAGVAYYVATNGNDGNPGTKTQPWASWQKAFTQAKAGDIVYIRGGSYYPTGVSCGSWSCGVYQSSHSGTSSLPINIWAYPGEVPVLDGRNMNFNGDRIGIYLGDSNYWYLKGLSVTRADQVSGGSGVGYYFENFNHNIIENCKASSNGGVGFMLRSASEDNLFKNCDAYDNYDSYTSGGDADGFDFGFITARSGNERINTLDGCRAWNNSDDGFDLYQSEGIIIFKNCWAWHQGYKSDQVTTGGDGNGFKLGVTVSTDQSVSHRTLTNCIAYDNRQRGFSQEDGKVKMILYNNIAYKNALQGYSFLVPASDILRNNVDYNNGDSGIFQSTETRDHNSWDTSGVSVSAADFQSVDASQLERPRKADGSLPDITFLHLAQTSEMIDKGTIVGLTYSGNAPDLGPFEYSGTTPVTCTPQCNANQCYSSTAYQTCSDTNGDGCNKLGSAITCPSAGTCSGAGICSTTTGPTSCATAGYSCGTVAISGVSTNCLTCTTGTCSGNVCTTSSGTALIIEGTNVATPNNLGIDVLKTSPTALVYRNNHITSTFDGGYMLRAGDDDAQPSNGMLNGEVITGNYLDWNGADYNSETHGIMTGYQKDSVIKYNYVDSAPMGIVRKSFGLSNTPGVGGVAYNIVKNSGLTSVVIKGMNNVNVYNNVFYSNQTIYNSASNTGTWRGIVDIYPNEDATPNSPGSSGAKIKNNIFYTKHQIYMIAVHTIGDTVNFESDYNIFYSEDGSTPIFNYNETQKTFAQWQALGYDTHSRVMNPNFKDTTNFIPSVRLDYGTNLGTTWQTGLSTTANWTVGVTPSLNNQNGAWQVGARIY